MQSYQANQEPNPKVEEHIASEHAQVSKEKAGEAVQATKESAVEAGQAASAKAAQAGEVIKEKGAEAYDTAAEHGAIAKEKAEGVVETVENAVSSAVQYVKEHLPPVEHAEPTPAERESQALLDEAAALVGDKGAGVETTVPVTTGLNKDLGYRVLNLDNPSEPIEPRLRSDPEEGPFTRVKPGVGEGVGDWTEGGLKSVAPDEAVRRRMEREEEGAKGPVKAATDYVKEHLHMPHSHSDKAKVHEWRALPGDVHIPLVAKAVREHVFHRPTAAERAEEHKSNVPWAGVKIPGYGDEPSYTTTGTGHGKLTTAADTTLPAAREEARQSMRIKGEKVEQTYHDATEKMAEKTEVAKGKGQEVYYEAVDKAARAYHIAADTIKDTVQAAEDRVKWAAEHTKEEIANSPAVNQQVWREEMVPKSIEEERLAHGEIPSSTAEVRAHGEPEVFQGKHHP